MIGLPLEWFFENFPSDIPLSAPSLVSQIDVGLATGSLARTQHAYQDHELCVVMDKAACIRFETTE